MGLSSDLISQFVKATNDNNKIEKESIVYGVIVEYEGSKYIKLDGSDLLTPISTTTVAEPGDRVQGTIKNHSLTVTGNMSSPSARNEDVQEIGNKISDFEIVIADKVSTKEFDAEVGRIDNLVTDNVLIKNELDAAKANIDDLESNNVTINNKLTANEADITKLKTEKLDASIADIKFATIDNLESTNLTVNNLSGAYGEFKDLTIGRLNAAEANINNLETNKLSATQADLKYANIDFSNIGEAAVTKLFSDSGIIKDLIVSEGHITGELVGVTIKGNLIEGGTVVADKLVVKGEDGLYYKLNTDGATTEAEQTDYNSLNGSVITANSITATKINVDDLVAFNATIGGFNISDTAIYSGVKSSVNNTTRGIYQDKNGQFAVGDGLNYLKYYQDTDGSYKLAVSAEAIKFSTGKTVGTVIQETVNNVQVGGRNMFLDSSFSTKSNAGNYSIDGEELIFNSPAIGDTVTPNEVKCDISDYFIKTARGKTVTLSFEYKVDEKITYGTTNPSCGLEVYISRNSSTGGSDQYFKINESMLSTETTDKWVKVYTTYNISDYDVAYTSSCSFYFRDAKGKIRFRHPKLEFGNKPTDWTLAPEDIDGSISEVEDNFEKRLDGVNTSISEARSSIDQLGSMISHLVTDGNGGSLMTQTTDGWTFNMSSITDNLNTIKDTMTNIEADHDKSYNELNSLTELVNDIANKTAYIAVTTDANGNPCIELGKSDNLFKVRITNTTIDFLEGSTITAYTSNRTFHSNTMIVKNELQIGDGPGFVWRTRENGNMGLIYIK